MATDIAVTLPAVTVSAESAFTVTRLREFVTSGLSDAALQVYLDAALTDIDEVLGPATIIERLSSVRGDIIRLSHDAESITTVVEDATSSALTLAADDYVLSQSGALLYRLATGTNPRAYWLGRLTVTYVREDATAARTRAAVALVQLDLAYQPGVTSQTIGTWTEAYTADAAYMQSRADILASLGDGIGII
jgi:hypothetical protein